jgi:GT2 family glycosyltransferase
MPDSTVSIIIPTKNRPDDIKRCLASIAAQSRMPDEIIVVDQSSRPYALPQIAGLTHIYDTTINGASAARNVGVRHSRSDILFFIDDDVELLPHTVERLLSAFAAAPDAIGMQCRDLSPERWGRRGRLYLAIFYRGFFSHRSRKRGGVEYLRWLAGFAMAYRRKLFDAGEFFDETLEGYSFGEDWELSQRARRYGTLQIAEGAELFHHASPVNRDDVSMLRRRWVNYRYFFEKLEAARNPLNHAWKLWWEIGEAYAWLRNGMGLPWSYRATIPVRRDQTRP